MLKISDEASWKREMFSVGDNVVGVKVACERLMYPAVNVSGIGALAHECEASELGESKSRRHLLALHLSL